MRLRQLFFYSVQIAAFGFTVYGLEMRRDVEEGGVASQHSANAILLDGFIAALLVTTFFYWLFELLAWIGRKLRTFFAPVHLPVPVVEGLHDRSLPVLGRPRVEETLQKRRRLRIGDHSG